MSYGADNAAAFGRAAYFVDRVLKGDKVAELPVEQAVTIKLILNLRAAKAIGVVIPEPVLLRSDELILAKPLALVAEQVGVPRLAFPASPRPGPTRYEQLGLLSGTLGFQELIRQHHAEFAA